MVTYQLRYAEEEREQSRCDAQDRHAEEGNATGEQQREQERRKQNQRVASHHHAAECQQTDERSVALGRRMQTAVPRPGSIRKRT